MGLTYWIKVSLFDDGKRRMATLLNPMDVFGKHLFGSQAIINLTRDIYIDLKKRMDKNESNPRYNITNVTSNIG